MKKVVVTGATSFLGSKLVEKLVNQNCFVYAVVRPNTNNINNIRLSSNVKTIQCDLDRIEDLTLLIDGNCDCFYHIAWNGTRVPFRDDKELQNKNYLSALKSYNVAKKLGCKTYISTGSQAEYGKCEGVITEDYNECPITEYGKAKLRSMKEIKQKAIKDDIKFGWIRIFSAYGPNDYDQTLISSCIEKMRKDESIQLTTCNQNWNYIYVDDVINILYELMICDRYKSEVFNVCSDDTRQLKEYVLEMKKIIKSSSDLQFGARDYNKSEGIISFSPSNKKVKEILGYTSFKSFEYGIKKMLEA